MGRHDLTDFEWGVIKPLLPQKSRGVPHVDDRRVLNGIFWVLRSGAPWADLPERYGPHTTCYNRFRRWADADIWDQIMDAITEAYNGDVRIIDGTSVRVQHSAATLKNHPDRCLGRSRGDLTAKIHAVIDENGLPVKLGITPGQTDDALAASELRCDLKAGQMVLADKAYDADWVRSMVAAQNTWANIPPKTYQRQSAQQAPQSSSTKDFPHRTQPQVISTGANHNRWPPLQAAISKHKSNRSRSHRSYQK